MGKPKIGDKLFLYGSLIDIFVEEGGDLDNSYYNSVMGYMTVGGYFVRAVETETPLASVPGLVTEILLGSSLTPETPFSDMEMIDVSDKMSLRAPIAEGTKIWMPDGRLPRFNI